MSQKTCDVCGKPLYLSACEGCGWSPSMCKCFPSLRCAKCGVTKAYHDKKNIMTKDHDWESPKPKYPDICPECGWSRDPVSGQEHDIRCPNFKERFILR